MRIRSRFKRFKLFEFCFVCSTILSLVPLFLLMKCISALVKRPHLFIRCLRACVCMYVDIYICVCVSLNLLFHLSYALTWWWCLFWQWLNIAKTSMKPIRYCRVHHHITTCGLVIPTIPAAPAAPNCQDLPLMEIPVGRAVGSCRCETGRWSML